MRTFTIALALALIGALAVAGLAGAASQRPMKGQFTISVTGTGSCDANHLRLNFAGAGHATHLGRITGVATNCTEFGLFTGAVPILDGVATFTAADGSTITTIYEGSQGAPVAGVAEVESTHTVVAGTGRFADAEGVWTLSGTIDFAAGSSAGSLSGWLSY